MKISKISKRLLKRYYIVLFYRFFLYCSFRYILFVESPFYNIDIDVQIHSLFIENQ